MEEVKPEPNEQERFNKFLDETKEKFDKYFGELGYVCFMFNPKKHRGESIYITNSPNDVAQIVEPYANAENVEGARQRILSLRDIRRKS